VGHEIQGMDSMKGSQINWNQVFYFSEIASCGSIKDAAKKLELSPSTLSEHIAQLESDLEVVLFHRQHRRLVLTNEGTRLYAQTKAMFESGQRLIDFVSPVALGCYPISVGLVPSPSVQVAYRLIADYQERFGPLSMKLFNVKYGELEATLAKGEHDFGFSDRLPERKDIVSECVSKSFTKFYVSNRWQESRFSELIGRLPLLICNAEPQTRSVAEMALAEADLAPSAVVTADYPSALVEMCQRGLGIGVFSEETIKKMNRELIRSLRCPHDAPSLQDNLYVLWTKDGENTAAVKHLKKLLHLSDS
jgi:DNA-binding transcriptional LysR family regulator